MDHNATGHPSLPTARGPLSAWVLDRLRGARGSDPAPRPAPGDGLGEDLQLALYLCYELHYTELAEVDLSGDLEWDPAIIAFRRSLEAAFLESLVDMVGPVPNGPVRRLIPEIIAADTSPSVSRHIEVHGTLEQMREYVIHRSAYQLKEGDGHTFGVARLRGRAKQLLVEIQAGEYGANGADREMHSALFAQTMRCLQLDHRPNAYLDQLPATALMISNLVSLFGLNRRWRGALVGHLAVFEMTSVVPMGRYARGLERLGASAEARRFYDVHVVADAEHEVIALDMAEALVEGEPQLVGDVLFGARCVIEVERLFAQRLLRGWQQRSPAASVAA